MEHHGFPMCCREAPVLEAANAPRMDDYEDGDGLPPWISPHLLPADGRRVRVRVRVLVPPSRETTVWLDQMQPEEETRESDGVWDARLDCWRSVLAGRVLAWRELTDDERARAAALARYNHDEES